jgi:hypothetical protein
MPEVDHVQKRGITRARATVVALALGAFLYGVLVHGSAGRSAAMFLGIPTALAILLALTSNARTITGGIIVAITLALLIVAPLVGEGYLCILMASPLFYLVGILVGLAVDRNRRKSNTTVGCLAVVLLPMCMEGVVPRWSLDRAQTVEASRMVNASGDKIEAALSRSPRIATALPAFLRIGFPRPLTARGDGLMEGSLRTIHFAGAEGDPPGDLTMKVAERRPGYVRFEAIGDTSKLPQWVKWVASEVTWRSVDAAHTQVTWRIHFERQLDPAWYFGWIERAAVRDAAAYLIEANATPEAPR